MLEKKVADLEAQISQLRTQVADLAHANKDLEDELNRTKVEADQQCDDTAKEALELSCKIF